MHAERTKTCTWQHGNYIGTNHSIYLDSKILAPVVYGPFGQSNMQRTIVFCPDQPVWRGSQELTVLIYITWDKHRFDKVLPETACHAWLWPL